MWYSKTEIEKKNNQGYVAEIGHPITNKHFCLLLFCILVPLPNWLSVRSGLMPIFRGEAQTLWSWAPKKQHNLPVGTAVLWNTKAAIRHKPQDSKIANYQIAAHYQNNALPCTIKTPELFCFFSRGREKKKNQWTCKWGQSEKYSQCISAFSKLREHFWECKYSTQTLQRHTVPAASEWQISPPGALTSLRHSSRTVTHPWPAAIS